MKGITKCLVVSHWCVATHTCVVCLVHVCGVMYSSVWWRESNEWHESFRAEDLRSLVWGAEVRPYYQKKRPEHTKRDQQKRPFDNRKKSSMRHTCMGLVVIVEWYIHTYECMNSHEFTRTNVSFHYTNSHVRIIALSQHSYVWQDSFIRAARLISMFDMCGYRAIQKNYWNVCTNIYTCIHVYLVIHAHTHIHAHMYMYINSCI